MFQAPGRFMTSPVSLGPRGSPRRCGRLLAAPSRASRSFYNRRETDNEVWSSLFITLRSPELKQQEIISANSIGWLYDWSGFPVQLSHLCENSWFFKWKQIMS